MNVIKKRNKLNYLRDTIKTNLSNMNVSSLINYFLVAYAFCIPISSAGTNIFESLILLLWILDGNWKYKFIQYKNNPIIIFIALFLIYNLISVLWATSVIYGLDYIQKYRHFLIIFVMYTFLETKYIKHIVSAFLISMFISEVVSYGIYFEFWTYKNIPISFPTPFMNHVDYSVYLSFTIMILFNRVFFSPLTKNKILYFLFAATSTINLFLNGGRTGQVIFIITFFTLFILNLKNKLTATLVSTFILTGILISAYNLSPNLQHRFQQVTDDLSMVINENTYQGSLSIRMSLWEVGLDEIKDIKAFGSGIGNEKNKIDYYSSQKNWSVPENLSTYDHHNMFITYAIQLGPLGLLLFLAILYSIYRLKFTSKYYHNITIIFLITFVMWSLGGNTFHLMKSMVFFTLFVGLLNKISHSESEGNLLQKS